MTEHPDHLEDNIARAFAAASELRHLRPNDPVTREKETSSTTQVARSLMSALCLYADICVAMEVNADGVAEVIPVDVDRQRGVESYLAIDNRDPSNPHIILVDQYPVSSQLGLHLTPGPLVRRDRTDYSGQEVLWHYETRPVEPGQFGVRGNGIFSLEKFAQASANLLEKALMHCQEEAQFQERLQRATEYARSIQKLLLPVAS